MKYINKHFFDLSLTKNQLKLAQYAEKFFSIKELEELDFSEANYSYKREIGNLVNVLYRYDFEDNNSLLIQDILEQQDGVGIYRYTEIKITKNTYIKISIKCKHNTKNFEFLTNIINTTLNFAKYKSQTDSTIVKRHIINNFSNKVVDLVKDNSTLAKIRSVLEIQANIIYNIEQKYRYDNTINNIRVLIDFSKNRGIILSISNTDTNQTEYIILPKTKIGISTISIIAFKLDKK